MAHWRGFTAMAADPPLVIESAQGCFLHTQDGRRLFDGVSNLWCNVHGHSHPEIIAAIQDQVRRVSHITTLGMTADVTEALATRLADTTPGDLGHVFFSSDGSSAVEAALKMAFQYWNQKQNPRPEKTRFLTLGKAYHGDTTGSVSLGGIDLFHRLFAPLLFSCLRVPPPCTYRLPEGVDVGDALQHYGDAIHDLIRRHHHELAGVVMEPLVQGAAGMVTHPPGLLARVRQWCDEYDVLLIVDEVATGFCKTGRLFACQHEAVTPDILCLGKGLSGGTLPLAATLAGPKVFSAFLGKASENRQFFHGHTFGGNPTAAAAALASLDLIECQDTSRVALEKAQLLRRQLASLESHPYVGDIRGRGLMIGIEIVFNREKKQSFAPEHRIGYKICQAAIARGFWLRPLGDVIVVMPAPVADPDDLTRLAIAIGESIEEVTRHPNMYASSEHARGATMAGGAS